MKKFYTNMTMQIKLDQYVYKAIDNSRLQMDTPISFPIITAINGYVAPGEPFAVITLLENNEMSIKNYQILKNEVNEVCRARGLNEPVFFEVMAPDDESVSVQLDSFQKLIDFAADDDEVYACITYGTKPMSEVLLTAVDYSCRIHDGSKLGCIVYGKIVRNTEPWHAEVYDMTALVRMDEIINKLSVSKVKNPKAVIAGILQL